MTAAQQQQAAKNFAAYWKGKGYEKGESQPFWLSLLRDVYGVEHPEQFIQFEEQVHLDHTSFIDGTIPATHVLIEQKGLKPLSRHQTLSSVLSYSAVARERFSWFLTGSSGVGARCLRSYSRRFR